MIYEWKMHNKRIKKYQQEGEIRDDADFIRLRSELERLMIQQMRADGYLPVHDMRSLWSTKFLGKKYCFTLTMFAAYAGPKRSLEYDFWNEGRLVKSH